MTVNFYRLAPTILYTKEGASKTFRTQEAVDRAWDEGWFGPPWLISSEGLLSQRDYPTKASIKEAVDTDPRYSGLYINVKRSFVDLMNSLRKFEDENEIGEFIKEE